MAIVHHKVTGMLTLFIADQITDEDHQLDEVNLSGTVTWKPVFPKGMSQAKASEPARLVSLKPIKSLVADGQIVSLSGTVSEIGDVPGGPGQELPVMIDDTPVWWECVFDVTYADTPVRIPSMLVDATEGDVDITTLVSAGGFPEVPMDDIEAVIATVRSMSRAAEAAIRRAEEAASAVGEVDAAAREAVRVAGESATAASESAKVAKSGADRVGSAEAVLDARDAAGESARKADGRAGDAEQAAKDAEQSASRASGSAGDAAASAGDVDARAKAADTSAKAAAASQKAASDAAEKTAADRVQTGADRVATGADRTSAAQSATTAEGAASTATSEADRATTEADRAQAAADSVDTDVIRREVTDQIAAVVDGAPEDLDTIREVAEYAQENRGITDTLNAAIGQKADKVHTHAVADVTGLQAALDGKAASSHTHEMAQVTGLNTALGAKLDASKIQVVSALPESPVEGTIYLVTGA